MMATEFRLLGMGLPVGSEALTAMCRLGWGMPPREPAGHAEPPEPTVSTLPNAARHIRRHVPVCFPNASPRGLEAKKRPRRIVSNRGRH
jgi:hypothetical protein